MIAVADNGAMADEQGIAGASTEAAEAARKPKARDLNDLVRYTMWSVFRVSDRSALEAGGLANAAGEVSELIDQAADKGIATRGCYDRKKTYSLQDGNACVARRRGEDTAPYLLQKIELPP